MGWFGEEGVLSFTNNDEETRLQLRITPTNITGVLLEVKPFKNFKEAKAWFDKNSKKPCSIWYNDFRDHIENDDPDKKVRYTNVNLFNKFDNFRKEFIEIINKINTQLPKEKEDSGRYSRIGGKYSRRGR